MNKAFLKASKNAEVAYQGEPGSFSRQAADKVFGSGLTSLPCRSAEDVFNAVARRRAEYAVIPIENTLAGSIYRNFDLLARHSLAVVAETSLRIEHNLIVHRGTGLRGIRQVYSHPAALEQCSRFLLRHKSLLPVSFYNTAGSVKFIREQGLRQAAAIASADAARIYGMKILQRGIEDCPENYTRFLVLARKGRIPPGGEKTSVVFGLENEPGVLFRALSVFALRNIDLAKIESRPIRGKPWEYLFYVDLLGDIRSRPCSHALRHLRELAPFLKVLGSYPVIK
ncbi:MAG: prephenate dehydratase [Acidobacteria bacterium]|nr:prephenate dehydratase [Acidobacteriota bacterium]